MDLNPVVIKTHIDYNGEQFYIPADCGFTRSAAWETVERRATDNTNTAQTVTLLKKYGYQPKTYQLNFVIGRALTDRSLWDLLADYEMLIGHEVEFTYSGRNFGRMLITDGTFSLDVDGVTGVARMQIAFNLRESIVVTTSIVANVRTV